MGVRIILKKSKQNSTLLGPFFALCRNPRSLPRKQKMAAGLINAYHGISFNIVFNKFDIEYRFETSQIDSK